MATISNVQTGPAAPPEIADVVTPTQAVILDANRVEYVVDALGRKLGFKRISAPTRRRVFKALSAASAEKIYLISMALTACSCVSIDGVPVPFPTTELQVDALIDRLEDEGIDAGRKVDVEKFSTKKDGDELKNS